MTSKDITTTIDKIITDYNYASILSEDQIIEIAEAYVNSVKEQSNLKKLNLGSMLVVGDIHGDSALLNLIVDLFLKKKIADHLVFLGDIVDRGTHSIACINLLLALLVKYPKEIHIVRGNHETLSVNSRYGFLGEVILYSGLEEYYRINSFTQENLPKIYKAYNNAFSYMPLALVHEKLRFFFVHGGIPKDSITLKEIAKLPRGDIMVVDPIIMQLLWNDPSEGTTHFDSSMRGEGIYYFGNQLLDEFLSINNLKMIIRAHEVFTEGFSYQFNKKLLSLFTSEEYYTSVQAKVALIDNNGEIEIKSPKNFE
ncbi:MAG TPA: metallophosphoesterase family protein [Candidatus Bathyarchaeia archaeon]|nr:metallophosphoesterase family protein [Candidatus Bathyarchaeia archaeon]